MDDPVFVTLGPTGTCHEHALLAYLDFQGLTGARVELVGDLVDGADLACGNPNAYLLQCSAHPDVHVITERFRGELFVVDTFLFPAKEMGVLVRNDVPTPRTIGVVPAARGYLDESQWDQIVSEPANPIVAEHLLAGHYDAGVSFAAFGESHPAELTVREHFGEVDTTWLVYGPRKRYVGKLIGQHIPEFFMAGPSRVGG